MSSCLKHANQTLNAMAVIASSLSLFLGIAHYLINMYLCSHKLRVIFYINYKHLKE